MKQVRRDALAGPSRGNAGMVRKAARDLRAAEVLLAANPPLLEEVVFHCQQTAEKAMKGFLAWNDRPFGKTHDLAVVGGHCVAQDQSLEPVCRRAERRTDHARAHD